jgi:hypothetical protein
VKLPSRRWLLAFAVALAGSLPGLAMANDRDLRATQIGAAACDLRSGAALRQNSGTVILYGTPPDSPTVQTEFDCALPLNNVDLGGTTNDNDITKFTVYYRDADGLNGGVLVQVLLMEAAVANGTPLTRQLCDWNSNRIGTGATTFTTSNTTCAVDLAATSFYWFHVLLWTNQPSWEQEKAAFMGIRFP